MHIYETPKKWKLSQCIIYTSHLEESHVLTLAWNPIGWPKLQPKQAATGSAAETRR